MRPVWRDGAFVPRLTMNLSASFDHRVVDGYDAAPPSDVIVMVEPESSSRAARPLRAASARRRTSAAAFHTAIIGVNKQVMRPVWRDGAFVPRLTMNLSASFDHRVAGGQAVAGGVRQAAHLGRRVPHVAGLGVAEHRHR
jgi:pyruvate/2-oxoglutarate dehydrogenase complex dihydrolipoamide acyltransferase (E2) component